MLTILGWIASMGLTPWLAKQGFEDELETCFFWAKCSGAILVTNASTSLSNATAVLGEATLGEERSGLNAFGFAVVILLGLGWGVLLGLDFSVSRAFYSTLIPEGSEAELMGFLIFASKVLAWRVWGGLAVTASLRSYVNACDPCVASLPQAPAAPVRIG